MGWHLLRLLSTWPTPTKRSSWSLSGGVPSFFAFSAWESRRFSFIFPRAYVAHGRLVLALNWLVRFLEIFMQDVIQEFSRFALGKEEVFTLVTLECVWWFSAKQCWTGSKRCLQPSNMRCVTACWTARNVSEGVILVISKGSVRGGQSTLASRKELWWKAAWSTKRTCARTNQEKIVRKRKSSTRNIRRNEQIDMKLILACMWEHSKVVIGLSERRSQQWGQEKLSALGHFASQVATNTRLEGTSSQKELG